MKALTALAAVAVLTLIAAFGGSLPWVFGVAVPYAAFALFIVGFVYRILIWAGSPVPFHIPTVSGQQKSLTWIGSDRLESPSTTWGVVGRMAMEVLLFRSLFRNDRVELKQGGKLVFGSNRYLWAGALLFHWSLAVILFRHLRLFTEPVLPAVGFVQYLDGFFQMGTPTLFITDGLILLALAYLLLRRMTSVQVRFITLTQDFFVLFLLGAIIVSGVLMRLFFHPDLVALKGLVMGLATFHPVVPAGAGWLFYVHFFLVSVLLAYFPTSKLMHAPGIFLSPTRNLRNDSRARRHINPWNQPVRVHTYEEWEDDFRAQMKEAGIPVEKP